MKNNIHLKALIITSLGVFLMSIESLFIKLTSISALTFSFYAGLFIFISLNLYLLQTEKKDIIKSYKIGLRTLILCGFFIGLSNVFFVSAIKTTTVANTVMILSSAPLFSSLFAYILYREKIKKNIFIASFFIFVGLYIIFSSQLGNSDMLGNFYALLCVSLFSLTFVFLSRFKDINRVAVTACGGFFLSLISFIYVKDLTIDLNTLYILLIAGLLTMPISRVLLGLGTRNLPASEVSLLMIIETIMAPIWVWVFLKEIPAFTTFVGGGVILVTLLLNSLYLLKVSKRDNFSIL